MTKEGGGVERRMESGGRRGGRRGVRRKLRCRPGRGEEEGSGCGREGDGRKPGQWDGKVRGGGGGRRRRRVGGSVCVREEEGWEG
jgi:hypothetical protein